MNKMVDTQSTISVIICAYTEKRWDDMLAAITSVQRQSPAPAEIILVIDHNSALLERVRKNVQGVVVIENTQLRGLSGARNCGVVAAHGEWVAFLDDDAEAEPGWLARISQCCEDPLVLGVGGLVVPFWPDKSPRWFPREFYWVIGCSYRDFAGEVTRVRNAFGCNFCIRREVFETVGGFRGDIGRSDGTHRPLGGEETELCIRAGQRWPERFFLCDPLAVAKHHIPLQRINWRYFRARCYAEGLSKAVIAMYAGTKDTLSSERDYTRRLLPHGVLLGLRDGLHGDLTGFQRAWMILFGLTTTVAGYAVGTVLNKFQAQTITKSSESVQVALFRREKEVSV